jgi:hypothetical protein
LAGVSATPRQRVVLAWMGVSGLLVVPALVFLLILVGSSAGQQSGFSLWLALWTPLTFAVACANVVAAFVLWHRMRPRLFRGLQLASLAALLTCPFLWLWLQ